MTLRHGLRFRSLQSRLATLYAALFSGIAVAVALVSHVLIVAHARDTTRAEMMSSGEVYDRLWSLRARSLSNSADVLARDFGFRTAVASGDRPTMASALISLRDRAAVDAALVVDEDGTVTGEAGPLRAAVAALPGQVGQGRNDVVVTTQAGVFRLVATPILAPMEIGLVVFAVRLDGPEMRALERLSAIPLHAVMIRRRGAHWTTSDGTPIASAALDALMAEAGPRRLAELPIGGKPAYTLVKRLEAPDQRAQAAILLSYGTDAALAPYRPLQIGLLLAGIGGLIVMLAGSRKLARGIVQPILALHRAAKALEEGARAEVDVRQEDEIGDLSAAFNRMSAGIVERESRISHMAFHDALTGLPNRAFFHEQLGHALGRAERTGEPVAVLCFDLDGFKVVNDSLGHPIGDELLRSVAAILADLARDGVVSRLGGDEFAVILAGGFDAERPRLLAKAVCDRFAAPVRAGAHRLSTSTSIGIVLGPAHGHDAEALLKNADLALYRAKEEGRNCFRFFDATLDAAARRRHQLELDLREAVQQGQFTLNYQPILALEPDHVIGFEALLRWQQPDGGPVSPAEFIPVAEETGLIYAIGEWVLREACHQASTWPESVRVAVNVSPLQFRNPGFLTMVMQALAQSGLAPGRLEVEITESVFLDGERTVIDLLHKLRQLGIRVALDDFGTGYSSLSYLRSFPFDKIKIDRSFITDVADDASAAAIVRAIIDLASALSIETTAEGVEDIDQLDRLRDQGCGSIQGFLFSRPVDRDGVGRLLHGTGPLRASPERRG